MLSAIPPYAVEIIEDPSLVVKDGWRKEKRSLRERLFSWPWNPFRTYKSLPQFRPDTDIWMINGKYVAHPETAQMLREQIEETGETVRESELEG